MGAVETSHTRGRPVEPDPLRIKEARDRILETAYRLFSRHGIHAVGIDRIIAEADVAKATLYHHYGSKEALVIAFLDLRQERWTYGWLKGEAERRAKDPHERVLAFFDAFDDWFRDPAYEGCSFIGTLLEINDPVSAVHTEAVRHLAAIREMVQGFLEDGGTLGAEAVSYQIQILMMGAIVSASRGDVDAALRTRPLAASLLSSCESSSGSS
jgi:AcrR family transcriptional regulator